MRFGNPPPDVVDNQEGEVLHRLIGASRGFVSKRIADKVKKGRPFLTLEDDKRYEGDEIARRGLPR